MAVTKMFILKRFLMRVVINNCVDGLNCTLIDIFSLSVDLQ